MIFFWILLIIVVLSFGVILLIGPPYLPTLKQTRTDALDLLDLDPGDLFVDLGSGDGTMLVAAAERGLKAVGYELNPFLVIVSRLRTLRYGKRVKTHWRSLWRADLTQADGIFIFLMTHHMEHLDKMLRTGNVKKNIKVVSHAFKILDNEVAAKKGAVFLYKF